MKLLRRSKIIDASIFSLQEGFDLGKIRNFLIDKSNLKIIFVLVDVSFNKKYLAFEDIKNVSAKKFLVNGKEDFSEKNELVKYKDFFAKSVFLYKMAVETSSGKKLGRVYDFDIDLISGFVEKIYAKKLFLFNNFVINRSDVLEVTDKKIIIKDAFATITSKTNVLPARNT